MIKEQFAGFLNTPPLWKKRQFDIQQFEFPNLDLHSFQAKEIPKNIRLGHQIEHIFKQLIEYSEDYDLLLYNLPINNEKRTIGEIDFILLHKTTNKLIHIELSYKFYIIDPEIQEPIHRLIGPNRRDTFFKKAKKIKNSQFPLLHTKEGILSLADCNIDHSKIEHQSCFKAQLFQPYARDSINIGTFNTSCIAGYWIRSDDLNKPEFANTQFYIPSKSEWIIEPHDQVNWKSHFDILIDVNIRIEEKHAPMVWLKSPKGHFSKIFVILE